MIPIFRPWFGEEEVEAVREVLLSGWVGPGPKAEEFERRFAEYVGIKHAIAVNSCSAALFLALKVLNVAGREVVTTSLTFVSTNHAILQNGAKPVFCDIDPETLNIDAESVADLISEQTAAILVMHYGGHPCEMDTILGAAGKHGIPVIEDAAHACGASYKGRMAGSIGTIGCFSFHAIKNLSTVDGGMLTTNDAAVAERLRRLRWMGIGQDTWERYERKQSSRPWDYDVSEAGYKFQMNDLNAAIGLVQLAKLESGNAQRREIALQYEKGFSGLSWFQLPVERPHVKSSFHAYVGKAEDRDGLIAHLADRGIAANVYYKPNHFYSIYAPFRRPLPITESIWTNLVTLPLFPSMSEGEIGQVIEAVEGFSPNGRDTTAGI